ncbi:MAG: acylneuraminate cytidylyltransferase family protein [Planctomycetes bacterium]|nr:acylneuraminate cytidylyltransferase family protein [Planctomycetota bacterium]
MTAASVLALIPARGGSKGIPRKNLLPILGKPLIAYTIEQAKQSRKIGRTLVSTDDPEIADVARKFGAEVPFLRPAEFAQDLSPDIDVFYHALTWLREHEGVVPELVVHLRPTGPLRRVELIDEAIDRMLAHPEADALRSVSVPIQSPYKMWRISGDRLVPLVRVDGMPESHSMPRQRLPAVYWQNGYVDVIRARTILQGKVCGDVVLPFIVEDPIHELDYPGDIPALEAAVREWKESGRLPRSSAEGRLPV